MGQEQLVTEYRSHKEFYKKNKRFYLLEADGRIKGKSFFK